MIKLDKDVIKRTKKELEQRTIYKDLTICGYKFKDVPVVQDEYSSDFFLSGKVIDMIMQQIIHKQEREGK